MRTIFLFLAMLAFQFNANACSWSWISFCKSAAALDTLHATTTVVSGVVSSADADGVDLDIIEVLGGVESRSTVRIWDGTDFDCNGLHSMATGDFMRVGDSIIIVLPMIDEIENTWDVIGDYRMPMPWGFSPILRISEGVVEGLIVGNGFTDNAILELSYDYFVSEFFGSGLCDLEMPNFAIRFYHDKNGDGTRDYDENLLPIGAVTVPGIGEFQNFKASGISLFAPTGILTVNYDDTYSPEWTTSAESTFEVEIIDGRSLGVAIGLTPTQAFTRAVFDISHDRFRCGEDISFEFILTNEGTAPESGTFWAEMDYRIETYVFNEEPDYVDHGQKVFGWDYEDLDAYESIRVPVTLTAPLIEDSDQLSEVYTFKMTEDLNNSRDFYCQEVELRCAFDPNDKQVFPLREDQLALKSVPLRYTIRFQNTGNDFARNVIVTDTLDEDLDLSTFKLVSTSHPRQLTISSNDGYDKKFEFTNIFLPDSISDEPNSHGFITFSISTKPDLPTETEIENTASIYFDFNPAIVTNTVRSIMVDSFPANSLVDIGNLDVDFYPNPTSDLINFSQQMNKVVFYDLTGREVKSALEVTQLNVSDLDEGTYLMVLSDGKNSSTKRIAVLR